MKESAWGAERMNREETRALLGKGKDAWNAWALGILERKKTLEDTGSWSADWFGEGQNPETVAWLAEARSDFAAVEFAAEVNFDGFVFPGPADFSGAHLIGRVVFANVHFASPAQFEKARFDSDADFTGAKFYDLANFDDVTFASLADFEKAEFLRETTGPLVPSARFQKTRFGARSDFRSCIFVGIAEFMRVSFSGNARFDEADFRSDANFEGAQFEGTVGLVKTRIQGSAKFNQVKLLAEMRASEVEFAGPSSFEEAVFVGKVSLRSARFGDDASFQHCHFADETRFNESKFAQTAIFRSTKFSKTVEFTASQFAEAVDFHGCKFKGNANFDQAVFAKSADFPLARFKDGVSFDGVAFIDRANFLQTLFGGRTSFRNVKFQGTAEFSASLARAAFVLSGAHFALVPGFHDASFREPPRLDHLTITDPLSVSPIFADPAKSDPRPWPFRALPVSGDPEYATRYRGLRKLAAETHDYEREREFFAQELRSRRFWHDTPGGRGFARFWMGWLYGGISDFGRSIVRPMVLWAASILIFTLVYLGLRRSEYFASALGPVANGAPVFPPWPADAGLGSVLSWIGSAVWWGVLSIFNLFAGGGCIAGDTGATGEALFLALKNSLFFLTWESPDAARRVYGCLYGFDVTTVSGNPMVRVPLSVSTAAIIENILGATLLLLFLLALRNLLRAR
jgi:hypothetical protein